MSDHGSEGTGDGRRRVRAARTGYVVLELGLLVAAVLNPGLDLLFALAAGAGLITAASGLGRTDGRARLGWLLIAIGAGVLYLAGLTVGMTSTPDRGLWRLVLLASLVMYPLWFVGLLVIGTSVSELRIHHVLDAAVAVLAAFAVVWLTLLHPHLHAGGQISVDTAAHVGGGFLVFGAAAAVAFARGVMRLQSWLFFSAVGLQLILATVVALALGNDESVDRLELVLIAVLWSLVLALLGGVGLTFRPVPPATENPRVLTPVRAGTFVALGLLAPAVWLIGVLIENQRLQAAATVPVVADGALTFVLLSRLLIAARQAQGQNRELARQAQALQEAYAAEQRLRQEITFRATHDELTGLVNRAVLSERLAESLPDQPGLPGPALLILDLDGFKDVNDSFGHPAGDELLVVVAGRLKESAPSGSVVARLGGDEFAVLVPRSSEAEALGLAGEICARVDVPSKVGAELVHVTASVGVVVVEDEPGQQRWTPAEALRVADIAMYEAKRTGRNRYVQYRRPVGQRP